MAKQETVKTSQLTDQFYEEMRNIYPNFSTNDREHMLIVAAISLAVREQQKEVTNLFSYQLGDEVRVLVDKDFLDRIDTGKPHEVFGFSTNPEGEPMVGIKNGKYWYYVNPNDITPWT